MSSGNSTARSKRMVRLDIFWIWKMGQSNLICGGNTPPFVRKRTVIK